jgi:hypothetical protein
MSEEGNLISLARKKPPAGLYHAQFMHKLEISSSQFHRKYCTRADIYSDSVPLVDE